VLTQQLQDKLPIAETQNVSIVLQTLRTKKRVKIQIMKQEKYVGFKVKLYQFNMWPKQLTPKYNDDEDDDGDDDNNNNNSIEFVFIYVQT
jgi:predicted transcriptional regulator